MSYVDYLKSQHWLDLRRRFYASKLVKRSESGRPLCSACLAENKPLDLHHKTYKRKGHERLMDLILLCHDCHDCHETAHRRHAKNPQDGIWRATKQTIRKTLARRASSPKAARRSEAGGK